MKEFWRIRIFLVHPVFSTPGKTHMFQTTERVEGYHDPIYMLAGSQVLCLFARFQACGS